jgi:hypothetical protein
VARIVEGNRREVKRRREGENRELWERWGYFRDIDWWRGWWRALEAIAMRDLNTFQKNSHLFPFLCAWFLVWRQRHDQGGESSSFKFLWRWWGQF